MSEFTPSEFTPSPLTPDDSTPDHSTPDDSTPDAALRTRITQILTSAHPNDPSKVEELFPLVYRELRGLAERYMRREAEGHTLQPTALVNEAYLRLVDQNRVDWQGRTHFFAVGAKIMHRLLIDHGRNKKRAKRGGGWLRITLAPEVAPLGDGAELDAMAVHEAIEQLAELDPRQAQLVQLRFFTGLSMAEIADSLGVSKRTAEGDWTHARAWLKRKLSSSA